MKEFKIIKDQTEDGFNVKIQTYLNEGWKPLPESFNVSIAYTPAGGNLTFVYAMLLEKGSNGITEGLAKKPVGITPPSLKTYTRPRFQKLPGVIPQPKIGDAPGVDVKPPQITC